MTGHHDDPFRRLRPVARLLRPFKPLLLAIFRVTNAGLRRLASTTHRAQQFVEWGVPPVPEWYDHYLDIYSQWPRSGSSLSLERGVFGSLAAEPGSRILDLCCGDGFNAAHFYAYRADRVEAVDFDPDAIAYACRYNARKNVSYRVLDIRESLPDGPFDLVTWDAAIEHFTDSEICRILQSIRGVLGTVGVLSGYTIIERHDGRKYLPQHEREFTGKEDLLGFLVDAFAYATVFETVYPERTNLYFYASNERTSIPFETGHLRFVTGTGRPDSGTTG